MKYTKMKRGRTQTDRTLWWGSEYDGGAYLRLALWRGCYLAAARILVGGEQREIGVSISLLWRTATLLLHLPAFMQRLPWDTRETGARLTWMREDTSFWDMSLSLDLWKDGMGTSFEDHKRWPWQSYGWELYRHPLRWIVGDTVYQEDEASAVRCDVVVRMPEGDYPATFEAKRVRWQRPRGLRAPWLWRGSIEVAGGIAHPGKGENSWDCDDDATYSCTFAAETEQPEPYDLAQRFALDVLKSRQRNGSLQWRPSKGWPAHCQQVSA